ncbi:hypothetical protein ES705_10355 [subsurface metagenome]
MDLADHRHTEDEGGVLWEALIRYAEVEISAADVLKLNSEPKELVAAPGDGKVLEFISLILALDYNSIPYTISGLIDVRYTDADGDEVSNTQLTTEFLDAETDQIRWLASKPTYQVLANEPLVLYKSSADVTGGNSPIHAKIAYRVHETGL